MVAMSCIGNEIGTGETYCSRHVVIHHRPKDQIRVRVYQFINDLRRLVHLHRRWTFKRSEAENECLKTRCSTSYMCE